MFGRSIRPENPNPDAEEMIEFNQMERQPVEREQLITPAAELDNQKQRNALAEMFMGLGNAGATAQGVKTNNYIQLQNALMDKMDQDQKDSRNEKFKRIRDILGVK